MNEFITWLINCCPCRGSRGDEAAWRSPVAKKQNNPPADVGKAHEEGQVPQSAELVSAVSVVIPDRNGVSARFPDGGMDDGRTAQALSCDPAVVENSQVF
jgi:hypothetical protein